VLFSLLHLLIVIPFTYFYLCLSAQREEGQRKRGIVQFLVSFIHASRPQRSPATHPALESSD
jgi:hypothetical protein